MNYEKLKSIIARKRSEIIALEKQEVEIRKAITDDDYTASELTERDSGVCTLPESITYKLRPMWQTTSKLKIEIKCIKKILNNSEEHSSEIVGCTRVGLSEMLRCQDCEYKPHSLKCVERRLRHGNGYVIQ
ncbi:hypothetical protein KAU33_09225 [Candidatus Dependentiae bacterium]|nr:hypothetical protein [Candidatus Dependentiae bacterium]